MKTNNDTLAKIVTTKESPKLHKFFAPRRGISLNSYNFEPSYLPSIGVPRQQLKNLNAPPLSRIEQNCKSFIFFNKN